MTKKENRIFLTGYYLPREQWTGKRPCTKEDQDVFLSTMDYPRAVFAAGGIPVLYPPINDREYIRKAVEVSDGLILTGGADLHPSRYGEEPIPRLGRVVPERDAFEWTVLETALKLEKPVLGICRGFQLINIFFGGTLYQDIESQEVSAVRHWGKRPKEETVHEVHLLPGSHLNRAYGTEILRVNSFHHQALKTSGQGLHITATSPDGLAEGLEAQGRSLLMAVQWHPEMMFEHRPMQLKLFSYFIQSLPGRD